MFQSPDTVDSVDSAFLSEYLRGLVFVYNQLTIASVWVLIFTLQMYKMYSFEALGIDGSETSENKRANSESLLQPNSNLKPSFLFETTLVSQLLRSVYKQRHAVNHSQTLNA